MASPFDDAVDYGTVTGQSTGFRGGPVQDGRLNPSGFCRCLVTGKEEVMSPCMIAHDGCFPSSIADVEFSSLQRRVGAAVMEINQQSEWEVCRGSGLISFPNLTLLGMRLHYCGVGANCVTWKLCVCMHICE